MKKNIISFMVMVVSVTMVSAQTLNVNSNGVSYLFSADKVGVMNYTDGKTVTIQDNVFSLDDIVDINVTDDAVTDNTVAITYRENSAQIVSAGNIARYISFAIDGAGVTVTQSDEISDDVCGEITYILSGQSDNGYFVLNGSYKASIELDGLSLVNPKGAAIDLQNGKRIAMRIRENTVNIIADGKDGKQKAAIYCKGHLEFKQKGTLNVTGNTAHAISAKEYIEVKNATINVLGAKKDGINCNQYFHMESGAINISGTDDDGIQVSFKDDIDREAEDTGSMTIKGGVMNIDVTAPASKAIKVAGDFIVSKGDITATASGAGLWDSENKKTKASSCIGVDGNLNVTGGTFNLTAVGGGGKGISVDGDLNISGGSFDISTFGGRLAYVNGTLYQNYTENADRINSDYKSSPKGIKVDGDIVIDGGTFIIETKGSGGEGIESKKTLTINGGSISIKAYEDGTNSSSHTYLNGGDITVTTGTGDAIDANGNIYVAGGNVTVIGAASPEQGFDAGDGYGIYITGGKILAAGGGNSVPSSSASKQAYVILTQSVTAGATVTISYGTTVLATFIVPEKYGTSTTAAKGPGGWGWGWGGSGGSSLLISTPDMKDGLQYNVAIGSTNVTATARLTGGGTSGH